MADDKLSSPASVVSDAENSVDLPPIKSEKLESSLSPSALKKNDEVEVFLEESENPKNMVGAIYSTSSHHV